MSKKGSAPKAKKAAKAHTPRAQPVPESPLGFDARRFVRNVLLWLLPAVIAWVLVTGFYNRFLITATNNVLHLVESPNVTDLNAHPNDPKHTAAVSRRDFPPSRGILYTIRTTDLHYHLILMIAMFMAVPGVPLGQRGANLGYALLVSVFFHVLLFFFWVQFVYATQLGAWSVEHYSAFAQNLFGLGKHVLDLPVKLAWPLVLWAFFYLRRLRGT